jgi:hypothetical protein
MFQRKKRQKRRERIEQARKWAEADEAGRASEPEAAKASEFISPFSFIKPRHRVCVIVRVTSERQTRNGNLDDRASFLRAKVEAAGAIVVDIIKHQGRGDDPSWLEHVAASAREHKADFIVAESTDRLIRREYSDFDERAQPGRVDFEKLRQCTGGFPLVTWADPDERFNGVKRLDAIRGQEQKQQRGGRPTNDEKEKQEREARKREQTELVRAVKAKRKLITPK